VTKLYKRLKLCGGQAYDRWSVLTVVKSIGSIYNLPYKAWAERLDMYMDISYIKVLKKLKIIEWKQLRTYVCIRGCIQKFPDWLDNEIYDNINKHSLRSNANGYGSKTHYTDSQNSDITAPIGIELYHLQFSLQAASPETFG
jgi:hypothetical protein